MNLDNVVEALREEQSRISKAIAILEAVPGITTNGRRKAAHGAGNGRRRGKRRLSAAAKKRISEAAKARWAKAKKAGKNRL